MVRELVLAICALAALSSISTGAVADGEGNDPDVFLKEGYAARRKAREQELERGKLRLKQHDARQIQLPEPETEQEAMMAAQKEARDQFRREKQQHSWLNRYHEDHKVRLAHSVAELTEMESYIAERQRHVREGFTLLDLMLMLVSVGVPYYLYRELRSSRRRGLTQTAA